jgi:hypothetical protein
MNLLPLLILLTAPAAAQTRGGFAATQVMNVVQSTGSIPCPTVAVTSHTATNAVDDNAVEYKGLFIQNLDATAYVMAAYRSVDISTITASIAGIKLTAGADAYFPLPRLGDFYLQCSATNAKCRAVICRIK